ncbi:MAG: rRNA adenine N-6-methyltransferase family protein, partial [Bdellovibrionota bacterium]
MIAQIVADVTKDPGLACLEIGPGQGALTEPLLISLQERAKEVTEFRFILVEKDRVLAVENEQRIARLGHARWAKVICADFLELQETEWFRPGLTVVSNLPYSSGTAMLTRLCGVHARRPVSVDGGLRRMTLMFQAEVAERVRAEGGPGSGRDRGSLSIWV